MRAAFLRTVPPVAIAGMIACASAQADIYTWVDKAGRTHVSNLEPPAGVRVISVQRTDPARAAAEQAARDAARQSEMQALEQRVQQLQDQVNTAARQPPAPPVQHIEYNVVVAAPSPPYAPDWTPPPASYDYPRAPYAGCDPSWLGCMSWWNPGIYPGTVVVAGAPRFGRHPGGGGARPVAPPGLRPVPPPGGVGPIPPPLIRSPLPSNTYFGRAPAVARRY